MIDIEKKKILTVVGTRPEIIRLSRVVSLLDKHVNHILVHTGQNYDYELNEIFFKELELRKPTYYLNVNTATLGNVIGDTLIKIEDILKKEQPDAMLVLGDTNSCLSAIMAKRLKIPIYHMEAGNRSYDLNVPEEINRRIIDHIADFNLVYADNSRRHLLSEGLHHRRIYLTGSPMFEVLEYYKSKYLDSEILEKLNLSKKNYFIVSVHREENVDNKENLLKIADLLNKIATLYDVQVVVSTHPRTKIRLEKLNNEEWNPNIQFLKPFGFFDYINLQLNAKCAISDSGTISEESSILGFPAISLRKSMERPEAMDAGTIILTGLDPDTVLSSIELAIEENKIGIVKIIAPEYQVPDTSWRVLKLILGTCKLSNTWSGIIENK
jgi:UDP-N-acetyl-L-fucosamine synthase